MERGCISCPAQAHGTAWGSMHGAVQGLLGVIELTQLLFKESHIEQKIKSNTSILMLIASKIFLYRRLVEILRKKMLPNLIKTDVMSAYMILQQCFKIPQLAQKHKPILIVSEIFSNVYIGR